eukprot:Sspe_Gene.84751::Locus_55639_Transcript_4_6_Confidence_0.333_Length_3197::g.84751::m.84751/K03151/thiI; tRNA uracil 4-sulfurtransferase
MAAPPAIDVLVKLFPAHEECIHATFKHLTEHQKVMHKDRPVPFDHAATTAMTCEALTGYNLATMSLPGNANSMHKSGEKANEVARHVRREMARMLVSDSATDEHVVFTDGGAAANELAFSVLPQQPAHISPQVLRDVVIIGAIEHPSIHNRFHLFERKGFVAKVLPVTPEGVYDTAALEKLMAEFHERVAFVTLHHVNNEVGTLQPIGKAGEIIKRHAPHAVFHVDCIQSFGRIRVDTASLNADLLSIAFHKVGGPKRHGALVAASPKLFPKRHRDTPDVAAMVAGYVAAVGAVNRMDSTYQHCTELNKKLTAGMKELCEGINVIYKTVAPMPLSIPHICTYVFPDMQGRHIVSMLSDQGIDIGSGAACASQNDGPSHVLTAMKYPEEDAYGVLRLSFDSENTMADIDTLLEALKTSLARLQPVQQEKQSKRGMWRSVKPGEDKSAQYRNTNREEVEAKRQQARREREERRKEKNKRRRIPSPPSREEMMEECPVSAVPLDTIDDCVVPRCEGFNYDAVMVTMGEVQLKGSNKGQFVQQLQLNILRKLKSNPATAKLRVFERGMSFYVIHVAEGDFHEKWQLASQMPVPTPSEPITPAMCDTIRKLLKEVPGLSSFQPVVLAAPKWKAIAKKAFSVFSWALRQSALASADPEKPITFAISSRRSNKAFPFESVELSKKVAEYIVDTFNASGGVKPDLKVDLKNPEIKLDVRVYQYESIAFVHGDKAVGVAGLPDGKQGKVLCMLSGGYDSPVAAQKMMWRGCRVQFIHFDGYPYTGKEVVLKIRRLQETLNRFQGRPGKLFVVPFSPIQEIIRDTPGVAESHRTLLYRLYMMLISATWARKQGCRAIVTGDNLGQVASQTLQNLSGVSALLPSDTLILRPLLTYSKAQILQHAREIGTYELSSLHGTDDCCTVFQPSNPVTALNTDFLANQVRILREAGIEDAMQKAVKDTVVHSDFTDRAEDPALPPPADEPVPPTPCPCAKMDVDASDAHTA